MKREKSEGRGLECARNNPNSSVQPGECRGAPGQDSHCAVPALSHVPHCWSWCPLSMRQCHVVLLGLDICSEDSMWNSQNTTLYTHSECESKNRKGWCSPELAFRQQCNPRAWDAGLSLFVCAFFAVCTNSLVELLTEQMTSKGTNFWFLSRVCSLLCFGVKSQICSV